MTKFEIILIGPSIKCNNCKKTEQIIKQVMKKFEGKYEFTFGHLDLTAKETIARYGILKSPAVVINDHVISEGSVPDSKLIEKALKHFL